MKLESFWRNLEAHLSLEALELDSFWRSLEAKLSLEEPGIRAQSGGAGKMSSVWRNQQAVVSLEDQLKRM